MASAMRSPQSQGVVELVPFPGDSVGAGEGEWNGTGPFLLPLSPKPVPPHLVDTVRPSAFVTNLWLTVCINPRGFTRRQLRLIAKSMRRSELGVGETAPLVIRVGGNEFQGRRVPLCTAVLFPSGRLTLMGAVSEAIALWHASRVAFKVKYRIWWKREGEEVRFVAHPGVRFSRAEARIQQLVVTVDLGGGAFKLNLEAVAEHKAVRGSSDNLGEALAVRVSLQEARDAADADAARLEDGLLDLHDAQAAEAAALSAMRKPEKNKGPTCLVYASGRLVVLGCKSVEAVEAVVSFVWPALVGL